MELTVFFYIFLMQCDRGLKIVMTTNKLQLLAFYSLLIVMAFISLTEEKLIETSVSCDQTNFILYLNFDEPFKGMVYTEEGYPNCIYVNGTELSHISYHLKIPLIGCETRINEEGNYENAIIVQENSAFLQNSDKKYLLTCIPTKNPNLHRKKEMTIGFDGIKLKPKNIPQSVPEEIVTETLPLPSLSELHYSVEVHSGHGINGSSIHNVLNIGDPISYIVRLQKPVANSQIGRCWANDTDSSLELSNESGCSLHSRGDIWNNFERIEHDNEVVYVNKIKAWAFPTSNEVNIFCNLRVCMSQSCEFVSCTKRSPDKKVGRVRRMQKLLDGNLVGDNQEFPQLEILKTSIRIKQRKTDIDDELSKNMERDRNDFPLLYDKTVTTKMTSDNVDPCFLCTLHKNLVSFILFSIIIITTCISLCTIILYNIRHWCFKRMSNFGSEFRTHS